MIRSVRYIAASAALVSCLVGATAAHAIAPHPLTSADTFGAAGDVGFNAATVADQSFQNALYLGTSGSEISTNMGPSAPTTPSHSILEPTTTRARARRGA